MTAWWKRHDLAIGILISAVVFIWNAVLVVLFTFAGAGVLAWVCRGLCALALLDIWQINRTGRVLWYRKGASDGDDS